MTEVLSGMPEVIRYGRGTGGIDIIYPSGARLKIAAGSDHAEQIVAELVAPAVRARVLADCGCIRFDGRGKPWLMNRVARGWGEAGLPYDSLRELLHEWDVVIGAPETDAHGAYLPVRRAP